MPPKETKAQRVERIKRERNPYELLPDLRRWAREGFSSIPKEDLDVRFRWWGLYTQGDGEGVFGKGTEHFMLRIRIPGGGLVATQAAVIADIAERYARGIADITVRHNIQLHWVRIEDVPAIFDELGKVGINTLAACGDVTRNITGCPVAGLDAAEICDASPLVVQATRLLAGNNEYYNLPRKFKISISGCASWCALPEINDVALTGVRHRETGEAGFSLRVGGGLSSTPYLARRCNVFVQRPQVLAVVRAIAEIFRDSPELRENRAKARMKFLFLEHGWTPERFVAEIEKRIGVELLPGVPENPPRDPYADHVGVHAQRHAGYCYAGFNILRGRITPGELRTVGRLAVRYGDGQLRTTNSQNIVVANIPRSRLAELRAEAAGEGLRLEAGAFERGLLACTGTEFCKLAITETKSFAARLAYDLEGRIPGYHHHVRINVNGCPNSCGQHWIADIGLQGCKVRVPGSAEQVEGYDFFLGGATGAGGGIARRVGFRCAATEVAQAIENVVRAYRDCGAPGESFREFCLRNGDESLPSILANGANSVATSDCRAAAIAGD